MRKKSNFKSVIAICATLTLLLTGCFEGDAGSPGVMSTPANSEDTAPDSATTDMQVGDISPDTKAPLTMADWNIGTLGSESGQYKTSDSRICVLEYCLAAESEISYTGGKDYEYIVMSYDSAGTFIQTSGWIREETYKSERDDVFYYRFVLKYTNARQINDENKAELCASLTVNTKKSDLIVGEPPADLTGKRIDADIALSFGVTGLTEGSYLSDMCFVRGELWIFPVSDDAHSQFVNGMRYKYDAETQKVMLIGLFKHNFGHCNTVDYSEENDCLIFGSGSGDYKNSNEFYVYPNAYERLAGQKTGDISDAIKYDCNDNVAKGQVKLNACWDENGGASDTAYLILNNNGIVHKVRLGRGSEKLTLGSYRSGAGEDEFNGSFTLVASYSQTDNKQLVSSGVPFFGIAQTYCNQGSDYSGGILYTGIGHDGLFYWENILNEDGTITRVQHQKNFFSGAGAKISNATEGFCIYKDLIVIGVGKEIYFLKDRL